VVLYASWFSGGGAARAGWYSYPPLSEHAFEPGKGQDLWILAIHLTSISAILGAINFIVTIHNMRAPGMGWMRLPLFVWSIYVYSILILIALTELAGALTLLLLDRKAGTHFFLPSQGGSAVLYQHMFWFFGHPEVYIMAPPASSRLAASRGSSSPPSRSTGRSRTRTSSSRTCTTCSSAAPRSPSSRLSTTGGQRCSGDSSTSAWGRSTSGSTSSGSI